ncbi:DUF2189 domain-containing protein [Paracoccus aestuarii]|uniref:DUF2189 domain-containing protein n=1 Tax=Paracoccus aestuarii TaxID=453842 RepID=A0A418ZP27_9RHOB|nr:DUF2189 domain-containing protein [Paracoccus aestuarii]RJK94984.1 DUF2189 domain-containing protein [Paracoccus aestuarii]
MARIAPGDLCWALAMGWHDFRRAPAFGLLLTAPYALTGLALTWAAPDLAVALALGFALIAPVVAVSLYEVSRRIEAAEPLDWPAIIRVLRRRGAALPVAGGLMVLALLVWLGLWQALEGAPRIAALGLLAGGAFAATVVGWPMLLDRQGGLGRAAAASVRAVAAQPGVMAIWAVLLAVGMGLAILPGFLGLPLILPILGHASWHLYRRISR